MVQFCEPVLLRFQVLWVLTGTNRGEKLHDSRIISLVGRMTRAVIVTNRGSFRRRSPRLEKNNVDMVVTLAVLQDGTPSIPEPPLQRRPLP